MGTGDLLRITTFRGHVYDEPLWGYELYFNKIKLVAGPPLIIVDGKPWNSDPWTYTNGSPWALDHNEYVGLEYERFNPDNPPDEFYAAVMKLKLLKGENQ